MNPQQTPNQPLPPTPPNQPSQPGPYLPPAQSPAPLVLQNPQSTPAVASPTVDPKLAHTNHLKLVWGLICLVGPTALIVLAILIYTVINLIVNSTAAPTNNGLFGQPSTSLVIANLILFVIGAISAITWMPGIIVGIVLLATRRKA